MLISYKVSTLIPRNQTWLSMQLFLKINSLVCIFFLWAIIHILTQLFYCIMSGKKQDKNTKLHYYRDELKKIKYLITKELKLWVILVMLLKQH